MCLVQDPMIEPAESHKVRFKASFVKAQANHSIVLMQNRTAPPFGMPISHLLEINQMDVLITVLKSYPCFLSFIFFSFSLS